jgi:hypothetical protein
MDNSISLQVGSVVEVEGEVVASSSHLKDELVKT